MTVTHVTLPSSSTGKYAKDDGTWDTPGGGPGATDHGTLTGLADDDHTQYHNDARGDARYSQLGHTQAWSTITSTPTTLSGYGITDAAPSSHVGSGGAAHANVIAGGAAGFMSGADKTKLDGIASGATANATDAALRDRATHTGTQAAATITGLATIATSGSASDLGSGTVPTARLATGTADATTYLRGDQTWATIAGGGDVVGQASSVDNEIALFSGTGGKTIKRATTTGVLKATSGVIAAAVAGTDFPAFRVRNYSTSNQGAGFATDTYVTNSGLLIPAGGMVAGMRFQWTITATKTNASTASPIYTVRIGANQSTADTSRLSWTASAAQTAVTDGGVLTISVLVRSVSASGVIAGGGGWASRGGATGFGGGGSGVSAAFDNSNLAGQYIGISINGGASASWTIHSVYAELIP